MLHEHAICYQNHLSTADLDYIIKKANRLGRVSRDIIGVHEEKDHEGTHIYFDVTWREVEQRGNAEKVL